MKMDIRIEVEELPEGGFRAYVYKIVLANAATVKGKELYANTAGQVGAKIIKRIADMMIDAILPAEKPKEK